MERSDELVADARAQLELEDATAQRILDAAVERFTTVGVRRTTMDDVAGAAGIGRATLYRRFAGRDEIVRAALAREVARTITLVHDVVSELEDPADQLVEGFVAIVAATRGHPLFARLLEGEPEHLLPFVTVEGRSLLAVCRDYLAGQLAEAQRTGRMVAEVDPEVVAELLVRLCHSLLLTPEGVIDAGDAAGLRRFARAYVAPLLFPPSRGPVSSPSP